MSKQEYNDEQIEELLSNSNVKGCTSKYITFSDDFKLKALEGDKVGIFSREIFQNAGFPEYIVNSKIPISRLKNWRYKMKKKGLTGLVGNQKGRPKKEKIDVLKMTKDEELEYLRTKVAYLEELKELVDGGYP